MTFDTWIVSGAMTSCPRICDDSSPDLTTATVNASSTSAESFSYSSSHFPSWTATSAVSRNRNCVVAEFFLSPPRRRSSLRRRAPNFRSNFPAPPPASERASLFPPSTVSPSPRTPSPSFRSRSKCSFRWRRIFSAASEQLLRGPNLSRNLRPRFRTRCRPNSTTCRCRSRRSSPRPTGHSTACRVSG